MGIVRLGQSLRIVRRDKQMNNAIPKEMQGLVVSKDVGGLTLVATWVRTDSFTELSNKD